MAMKIIPDDFEVAYPSKYYSLMEIIRNNLKLKLTISDCSYIGGPYLYNLYDSKYWDEKKLISIVMIEQDGLTSVYDYDILSGHRVDPALITVHLSNPNYFDEVTECINKQCEKFSKRRASK